MYTERLNDIKMNKLAKSKSVVGIRLRKRCKNTL